MGSRLSVGDGRVISCYPGMCRVDDLKHKTHYISPTLSTIQTFHRCEKRKIKENRTSAMEPFSFASSEALNYPVSIRM